MHVHVVQKGDTLWKISRQYGVSFDEVKRLNAHLANPDYIVPGMKIFVPEKSTKMKEMKEHPYTNDRPVKKSKEEYTAQPAPKPMPAPKPTKPTMQPPMPQPIPIPQPPVQMPPQMMPQPINQNLTMTQMMPPFMGIPYGWMPVPDMDVNFHVQMPAQAAPQPPPPPIPAPTPIPKPMPMPTPMPKPMPMPMPKPMPKSTQGWELDDSSSLADSSSLEIPMVPPQYQAQPQYEHFQAPPCGCAPPPPRPCGCGHHHPAQHVFAQPPFPTHTLGETQGQNYMMPQHMMPQHMMPQHMMPQHMMPQHMPQHNAPFMACAPCHMWPAPQGQWGHQNPDRYY